MKTILIGLAVSAAAITGPAAAQTASDGYQHRSGSYQDDDRSRANFSAQIEQLRVRIQAGMQSGAITRREAMPLQTGLRSLTQLERRYSRDGLTEREARDLQVRLQSLRDDVRQADYRSRGRYDDRGRQNGRDDDRYDDRNYGRDDRWDDDDDRDDDRYRQPQTRGGLGGLIDGVLGRNNATLQVGQRAPADLYGVPYEDRERYRDTDRAYYRSDGRQIYQIDARSQTVIRIHPMNR